MRLNTLWRRLISVILCGALMLSTTIVVNAESYEAYNEQDTVDADISTFAIDQMLKVSQQWLSDTYGNNPSFGSVPIDGTSRRSTVNACIRALQIELGITNTADNFGSGTISRFKAQYPNGVVQQEYPSTEESNVYGIIQCALWTKGYYIPSQSITKHFYDGTGNAIIELKEDMGFQNVDSTVTLEIMKALLSMNYYVAVGDGTEQIRQIQQELNRDYHDYLGIIPCDGLYTRSLNKALIIVLQAIEGYSVEEATGNFGTGTKNNLPLEIPSLRFQDLIKYYQCVKLIQYALCCNGYGESVDLSNTQWNDSLSNTIKEFQRDMNIEETGLMNVDTWMALLLSKGNPDRACVACDTRFAMTQERIDYLISNDYEVVGRYLTGSEKGVTIEEVERILDNGLGFFPIFQETLYTDTIKKYNSSLGLEDVQKATAKAAELGIPTDAIIYYAIDFDPTDYEIQNYVIPYFESIHNNTAVYRVGVYGTRNVCQKLISLGYAETCFVSDMSTGYSGNMGFKMPTGWNLDQFSEMQVTTSSGIWDLDKVSYSGKFPVVTSLTTPYRVIPANVTNYHFGDVEFYKSNCGNWFKVSGKKMRYRIVWETEDYTPVDDSFVRLDVNLEKKDIGTVWRETRHYNVYEYQTDWMNVSLASTYRFQYFCTDDGVQDELNPIYLNAKVSVYIDTTN